MQNKNRNLTTNRRDSEQLPVYNLQGSCGHAPEYAFHFPGQGENPVVPTIDCGVIRLNGAIGSNRAAGIQQDGASRAGNPFSIPYDAILNGGSGVKIRCCTPKMRKRMRAKCCEKKCTTSTHNLFLKITQIETCEVRLSDSEILPFEVGHECGCMESCCQKYTRMAEIINANQFSPINAAVVNIGNDYFLEIESRNIDADFTVDGSEGFGEWKEVVPFYKQRFNAKNVDTWFTQNLLADCAPDECFLGMEIYWLENIPFREAMFMGSNPTGASEMFHQAQRFAMLTFQPDPGTPGVSAAMEALKTILLGTNNYNKKLCDTACPDDHLVAYCIKRTDAGDSTALTAIRSAYNSTSFVTLDRTGRKDGVSFYTATYKNRTVTPTAVGQDSITAGVCDVQDFGSCNPPSSCPTVTSSCCGCNTNVCVAASITAITPSPAQTEATYPTGTVVNFAATVVGDGPFTYEWSVTDPADDAVALTNPNGSIISVTGEDAGEYVVALTVTNCDGQSTVTESITVAFATPA